MEQNYIKQEIEGIKESNLEKIKSIFPSIVKDGQVDFEELKNMLGNFEEVEKEKYEFTWCGKQKAKQTALDGIKGKTLKLVEEDSKNIDTTENLYIEGDNLEALKLLKNNYAGKIKMIYIDPPYNTGNDFVYNDSFKMSNEEVNETSGNTIDGEKQVNTNKDIYSKNSKEESKYHSNWLNMMYPRLKLAQELLTDDGVIFISIDDNEQGNLKKICDEIYGENNFVDYLVWKKMYGGKNDSKWFAHLHDYILVYAKNKINWNPNPLPRDEKQIERYKNLDNDERGVWTSADFTQFGPTKNCVYEIITPNGTSYNPKEGKRWITTYESYLKLKEENRLWFGENGGNMPRLKRFLSEVKSGIVQGTVLDYNEVGHSDEANKELKKLLDYKIFDYPKPVRFLNRLEYLGTGQNDLILDFFSGSSTTAHSCMKLNSEDGENRKFIMVQLPEVCDEKSEAYKAGYKNICEIGKERIRRAGEQIKEELVKAGELDKAEKLDIGFKVLKVDDTNINWERESYKKAINEQLIREGKEKNEEEEEIGFKDIYSDFVEGTKDIDVVYELMLRYYGVSLTEKIDTLSDIGNRTYSVCDTLIVCLEDEITREMIDKLSEIDFAKIYFRDSSFKGNNALELKENLMTRLELQRKNKNNVTYRVEFI